MADARVTAKIIYLKNEKLCMAFLGIKSKRERAQRAAKAFLREEQARKVSSPKRYVETVEEYYYSEVRSRIEVNVGLNEKIEGLFRAAREATRGSEAEESANLALWEVMSSDLVQEAAKFGEAAAYRTQQV